MFFCLHMKKSVIFFRVNHLMIDKRKGTEESLRWSSFFCYFVEKVIELNVSQGSIPVKFQWFNRDILNFFWISNGCFRWIYSVTTFTFIFAYLYRCAYMYRNIFMYIYIYIVYAFILDNLTYNWLVYIPPSKQLKRKLMDRFS
jgi:hypothetical protein